MEKGWIGVVGLGLMGGAMVRNLLVAGFRVIGYDVDPGRMDALGGGAFRKAESPEQIPLLAETILLSLPNSSVVNRVIEDSLRLFETGREGLLVIDTTTADPVLSAKMAGRLNEKGIAMVDAAISGTSRMCGEREVTFLVGGSEAAFQRGLPVFSALGRRSFHMGDNGAGATAKLVVNLVLGLNRMALAEGLCLAEKAGMDPGRTLEVLKESAAYSSAMDQKGRTMVEKAFLPAEGKLAFHLKDVRLMLELAHRVEATLPLSALHAQALGSQVAKGRGEWDNAAILAFYRDLANLGVP